MEIYEGAIVSVRGRKTKYTVIALGKDSAIALNGDKEEEHFKLKDLEVYCPLEKGKLYIFARKNGFAEVGKVDKICKGKFCFYDDDTVSRRISDYSHIIPVKGNNLA